MIVEIGTKLRFKTGKELTVKNIVIDYDLNVLNFHFEGSDGILGNHDIHQAIIENKVEVFT